MDIRSYLLVSNTDRETSFKCNDRQGKPAAQSCCMELNDDPSQGLGRGKLYLQRMSNHSIYARSWGSSVHCNSTSLLFLR